MDLRAESRRGGVDRIAASQDRAVGSDSWQANTNFLSLRGRSSLNGVAEIDCWFAQLREFAVMSESV